MLLNFRMKTSKQTKEFLATINSKKIGNEKRKESCKNVGAEKKNKGHKYEKDFLKSIILLNLITQQNMERHLILLFVKHILYVMNCMKKLTLQI